MGRRSPAQPAPRANRHHPRQRAAGPDAGVERLRQRFAKFRRDHPPQTRIPNILRSAVVAAVRQGVGQSKLRRACGLGSGQIERWQQILEPTPKPGRCTQSADARVFRVLDEPPTARRRIDIEQPDQPLELRLGDWSICVRQVAR